MNKNMSYVENPRDICLDCQGIEDRELKLAKSREFQHALIIEAHRTGRGGLVAKDKSENCQACYRGDTGAEPIYGLSTGPASDGTNV